MREIVSRQNETLKAFFALRERKVRERERKFLVESRKMCFDAMRNGTVPTDVLIRKGTPLSEEERGLLDALPEESRYLLSEQAFDRIAETESPQGVVGCFPYRTCEIPDSGDLLILDRIQDPGNVGTLLRTAAACGTPVLLSGCADVYNAKCVRSSMGGIFSAVFSVVSEEEAFAKVGSRTLFLADLSGENALTMQFPEQVALVIGNEGKGVSEFWRARANGAISLPMERGIESLNAAVSGSILLYRIKSRTGW